MNSMIVITNKYCDLIKDNNPFFNSLEKGELDDMMFMYQLRYWCNAFIDCLFLSVATTNEPDHKKVRRKHALAEGNHPDQLEKWMGENGFAAGMECWPVTVQTLALHAFVRDVAHHHSAIVKTFILNVLSEKLALYTFQAIIKHFGRERLYGPYFHEHQEVDEYHAAMGTELISEASMESERTKLEKLIEQGAWLYDSALKSWSRHE